MRVRIEQQAHWRQAQAVLEGRQPPIDPDQDQLELLDDGIRLYRARQTHHGTVRMCKRLVNGAWQHGMLEESFAEEPVLAGAMAHVA